jgi:hypothetical protein
MNNEDANIKYFNVPVQLLSGFLIDTRRTLNNIFNYAIYDWSLKFDSGTDIKRIQKACKYFNVTPGDAEETLNNGRTLYNSIPAGSPKVGINLEIYWDYYENYKTDFEKAVFLGFHALKSIVQNKAYCKITNKYLWSRMDGKASRVNEISELSPEIRKYTTEYQTVKIKKYLRDNFHMIYYSHFMRGFCVTFNLTLDQLIYEVEKRRKKQIETEAITRTKEARRKALELLSINNKL